MKVSSATYASAKLLSPDTAQLVFQEPIHVIYQVPRAEQWSSRHMQCCLARVTWYIHQTDMLALGRKVCAAFPKILHGKQQSVRSSCMAHLSAQARSLIS